MRIRRAISELAHAISAPAKNRSIAEKRARMPRSDIDLHDRGAGSITTNFTRTIQALVAGVPQGASGAIRTAIDVRFIAVFHAIVAFWSLAKPARTHSADAIAGHETSLAIGAITAGRPAAIDIRFLAVGFIVEARRSFTNSSRTNFARTIEFRETALIDRARGALHSPAIDITLISIFDLIVAFRRYARAIHAKPTAAAIRAKIALHTLPGTITNFARVLITPGPLCRRRVYGHSIEHAPVLSAFQSILGHVFRIDDHALFPESIAFFAHAIPRHLPRHEFALGFENELTRARDTRSRLTRIGFARTSQHRDATRRSTAHTSSTCGSTRSCVSTSAGLPSRARRTPCRIDRIMIDARQGITSDRQNTAGKHQERDRPKAIFHETNSNARAVNPFNPTKMSS